MSMTHLPCRSVYESTPRGMSKFRLVILRVLTIATIGLVQLGIGSLDVERMHAQVRQLERGESPLGNPLQGLVP